MKFFSEFGSCYRATESPVAPTTPQPLTCARSGRAPCPKRNRSTGSSALWSPALSVISEDGAVVSVEQTVRSEKKQSGKAGSKAKARVHRDEFRKPPMPMVFPAFSPTPFLF